jgi:hypothetical protein
VTNADMSEIQHIADGGSWCLDGRKERKLARLGYIETRAGQYGWFATEKGRLVVTPTITPKED